MNKHFLFFIIFFIVTQVMAESGQYSNIAPSLQKAIQAYGYKCDKVDLDSIVPFSWSGKSGYHIYCNEYQYGYEVEDKGGKIVVTVK